MKRAAQNRRKNYAAQKLLAQALAISLSVSALAQTTTASTNPTLQSDGRGKFSIDIGRALKPEDGRLALLTRQMTGREVLDLSALATVNASAIDVDLSAFPLAPGLYVVDAIVEPEGGKPTSLGRVNLVVARPPGAVAPKGPYGFVFTPTLDVGMKAQVVERSLMGATATTRPRFYDLTAQGGVEARQAGPDWEVKARLQYAGSSLRTEALTYGTDSVYAAKVNVQDYLFDAGWRDTRVQLGAVNATVQPVLASNISNRGAAFAHRLPFGLEISGATQSSIGLIGADNFTGLDNQRRQSRTLNLGYDFVPANPGQTRLDVTYFDGRTPNVGATVGAASEESNGLGGRFLWRNQKGDIRTEWVFAQSNHTTVNPDGVAKKDHGNAYTAELGYDALKDRDFLGSKLAITTAGRFERSSPLYRSLGSNFVSNYQTMSELIGFQLGSALLQVQGIQRFDNVDADRAYIRNRINAHLINLNLPPDVVQAAYASWFKPSTGASQGATSKPSIWVPTISFSHNVYDGFGDKRFVPEGFTEADLPHVLSSNSAMGLGWRFEQLSFNWKGTFTRERNLQIGEENTSTRNLRHGFSFDYVVSPSLTFGAGYDRGVGERLDDPALKLASVIAARAAWKINDKNDLSLDFNRSRDYDSINTRNATSRRAQIQWTSRRDIPVLALSKSLPLKTYVRALASDNYNWTSGATNVTSPRIWAIQIGGTVSFF